MEYVNFGSAGVKVSRLALGLGFRGQPDASEAQKVIEKALDLGINLIDCANLYGPGDDRSRRGESEMILGKVLKGKRDDVVITSKVASAMGDSPNNRGLSRYNIMQSAENSLTRLKTDHIDVYLVHSFDVSTPLEETIRALDDLVTAGKVRYVGCCNHSAWEVCKALWLADRSNATSYMCIQNPYNLLNRDLEREMFGLVRDQGLGVMVYSPLAIGLLSGVYSPDGPAPSGTLWGNRTKDEYDEAVGGTSGRDVLSILHELATKCGKTPAQIALSWVLSHEEITVAISGADTVDHIKDNLGALDWTLDDEDREKLDAASGPSI